MLRKIMGAWVAFLLISNLGVLIWTGFDIHNRIPISQISLGCMLLFGYVPMMLLNGKTYKARKPAPPPQPQGRPADSPE